MNRFQQISSSGGISFDSNSTITLNDLHLSSDRNDGNNSGISPFNFYLSLNRLKFWKKHSSSISITECELTHKVIYLGNVLTPWAKGDQSVNRALDTLWTNYCSKRNSSNDIGMRLTICNSGLKAETKQFGLTEYWANRVTYCCWKSSHPKLLCWVYRHVGRKGKPELRCHAVLCPKEETARRMAKTLEERLAMALQEFLREKILRQRARLSLVEIPIRKQLLVKGLANFRPPLERSRSAPKLMAIVEDAEKEEEEEQELLQRLKIVEEEEEDFAEMSSISLDEEEEMEENSRFKNGSMYDDDDENDSAIDSESFKSDEIVYSTNG